MLRLRIGSFATGNKRGVLMIIFWGSEKSQARQCWDFCNSWFIGKGEQKSAVQKPKHCLTWDFSLPLVILKNILEKQPGVNRRPWVCPCIWPCPAPAAAPGSCSWPRRTGCCSTRPGCPPWTRSRTSWRIRPCKNICANVVTYKLRGEPLHHCSSTCSPCLVMFFCASCEGLLGR